MATLEELDPRLQPYAKYLVSLMEQYAPVRVTSVFRSYTEQLELYRNRANNPYPVAPPGQSFHGYRLAFDLEAPDWLLQAAGVTWESWGGTWGGRFHDPIHFSFGEHH